MSTGGADPWQQTQVTQDKVQSDEGPWQNIHTQQKE